VIYEILTIAEKEWKEYLHARGTKRGTALMILLPVFIFGILLPVQSGREWMESSYSLISFVWLPLLFVSAMTADSFAGERERRTLETLLASRLQDGSILIGKFLAAVSYGLTLTGLIVITGTATVNITFREGGFTFYPLKTVLGGAVILVLLSCLVSAAGILVSLRAPTVRQAHQTMSFAIVLVLFLPMILLRFLLPRVRLDVLRETLGGTAPESLFLAVVLLLSAAVAALLATAMKRFRRTRMILD